MARDRAGDEDEDEPEGRGRSARKREVRSYDAMALELLELPAPRAARLPVTESFREGLRAARETRSKAARRRHIRHLAGLLRDSPLEREAIRGFLSGAGYTPVRGDEDYRELEELRTRLCEAESYSQAFDELAQSLPHVDLLLVQRLAQAAQLGDDEGERARRALFKELRRAADESELDQDSD